MIDLVDARTAAALHPTECANPNCHENSVRGSLCELHDFVTRTGRALPPPRWCVAWMARDRHGRIVHPVWLVWCATADGHQHLDTANDVPTYCGYHVSLPAGSSLRVPTCDECLGIITREVA